MDYSKIDLEKAKEMSFTQLREYADSWGVPSPTAKTMEENLEYLKKLKDGKYIPVQKSKRGRPKKPIVTVEENNEFNEKIAKSEPSDEPYKPIAINSNLQFESPVKGLAKLGETKKPDKTYDKEKPEIPVKSEETINTNKIEEITDCGTNNKPQENNRTGGTERNNCEGILELHTSGYGFLRVDNYEPSKSDVYVSVQTVRKYNLMRGDYIKGFSKKLRENESPALCEIISVNDLPTERLRYRKCFDDLTPFYPDERIKLEIDGEKDSLAIRCIDLLSPIGMGQRGLVVSPPKAGKTTLLKMIAQSIEKNYPNIKLIMLLIDERPEEVTDIKRSIHGEVVYSTFDEMPEHHIRAAELVLARAKRLVEADKNVVILLDSITRLARAYNANIVSSGKTLSGGLDPVALPAPKRFFGAARNIEYGGSLTIIATALVETGSRMDDVIYEEFKGTGNMEIHLSRELSEKRIFPAIDLYKSGTRKEELLLSAKELDCAFKIRRILSKDDASENLLDMMRKTKSNADFTDKMDEWLKLSQRSYTPR